MDIDSLIIAGLSDKEIIEYYGECTLALVKAEKLYLARKITFEQFCNLNRIANLARANIQAQVDCGL